MTEDARAVDTSVIVAAFCSWHQLHEIASESIDDHAALPAHCALEAFAMLTRLPEPFRASPEVVVEFLNARFGSRFIHPKPRSVEQLPHTLASLRFSGGSTYDALVATTARDRDRRLMTLDRRAEPVYRALQVDYIRIDI